MAINIVLTLTILTAAVFNVYIYATANRGISFSEYTVLNAFVSVLMLLQNYMLVVALYTRIRILFKGMLYIVRCTMPYIVALHLKVPGIKYKLFFDVCI